MAAANPGSGHLPGLTYAGAGVDIGAYAEVLARLVPRIEATHGPEVRDGVGPFAGLFDIGGGRRLAASADGVGTKIKVAIAAGRHSGIGHDLVNHCVNDIATAGARPLFFLDYFAAGRLDGEVVETVVGGVADACRAVGCALLGGETAEMPGVYALGDYDLAGFIVGLVEEGGEPPADSITEGDVLVRLPSSGPHTNGYSLIRQVLAEISLESVLPELGLPLADVLLAPHRCYLADLDRLRPAWKAAAHITGGGLLDNLPRALPAGLGGRIRLGSWEVPPIFDLIRRRGRIDLREMFATFNMGVGMVLVMTPEAAAGSGLEVIGEVVVAGSGPRLELVGA